MATLTYDDVLAAENELLAVRRAYLLGTGWKERPRDGRWIKEMPWGAVSTRRFEADLLDAVRVQAAKDEDMRQAVT